MHHRKGGMVRGHYRNGVWVSEHYRSGTLVSKKNSLTEDREVSFYGVLPLKPQYECFINPNASCPVCGAQVFFYQSEFGGRVFFDELGPPWPKHPCTNNFSIPKPPNKTKKRDVCYNWQLKEWEPIYITQVKEIDQTCIEIIGKLGDKTTILYTKNTPQNKKIERNSLAQWKCIENSIYLSLPIISKLKVYSYRWEVPKPKPKKQKCYQHKPQKKSNTKTPTRKERIKRNSRPKKRKTKAASKISVKYIETLTLKKQSI